MSKCSGRVVVGNERGIHSRIATRLAEISLQYEVHLRISNEQGSADCSMILDVLALGLVQGDNLQVVTEGAAAEKAMHAVKQLLTAKEDPL
ncbi:MAG: HPr family phosphocarrier protein [Desulfobulbus sp.]|nr:HPr family phosphocarrier protein [Desulfobulbus sp.]